MISISLPPSFRRFTLTALVLVACSQGTQEREEPTFSDGLQTSTEEPEVDTLDFEETPVGKHGRLRVEGTRLVDEHGDPVQLRGVSSMWLNWENSGYALNFNGLKWMRDNWNVTLIRAAMGVMNDQRQSASGGYLTSATSMENQVDRIVSNATRLGVYVLIDWHDHFAFDSTEKAKEFFARQAAKYKDNPSVIYEPFNEPVPGDRTSGDRFTWAEHIKPYHEEIVATIREHDPEGVIVLGTPFWSQNVDEAAADPVEGENLMYTLHFYSCTHDDWLRQKAQLALDAGLALFVTEWGATEADGGTVKEEGVDPPVCDVEADAWHTFMDQNWISWAAWKLDDCRDASCLFRQNAPRSGGWDDWLQGHGPYVVEKLLAPLPTP